MEITDPLLIFYFTIASFSMASSLIVLFHLLKTIQFSIPLLFKEFRVYFLFFLQFSLLFESIASLPLIFNNTYALCQLMGWLRFYSGLSNVMVLFFFTYYYLSFLTYNRYENKILHWIYHYSIYWIVIFPCITLLPFITSSYSVSQNFICTLPLNPLGNLWSLVIFYGIIVVLLTILFIEMIYSSYKFYALDLPTIQNKQFFYSFAIYIYISLFCWIPRAYPRIVKTFDNYPVSNEFVVWITIPVYFSGIFYAIVYFIDIFFISENRIQSTTADTRQISMEQFLNIIGSGSFRASNDASINVENPINCRIEDSN